MLKTEYLRQFDRLAIEGERDAWLTGDQPWPAVTPSGIALFTAPAREPLLASLATYGLSEVQFL